MIKNPKLHTIIQPSTEFHHCRLKHLKYAESIDFDENEKYDIFTNDETQTKNYITKSFIEIINILKKTYEAKNVYIAFFEGRFYLGLFTYKKLMQTGSLTKPVYTNNQFEDFTKEIVSVLKIIDYFNNYIEI